ncbi:Flp pilus assembly protein CpaB [Rhodopirellula halodulae]|uniref:Flp pilus assembly protein CpaB n=1 Tax=Rhodopirellula halodulae TaxID=2894198 RepID=UPI001E656099|nr:Flp pilus assembly protein CpaB [Rhodopirellula sp. JC737]MCC9658496.1 Flp pilus assembly protein CpaB [Rhodopirellula sp. JC737]
MRNKSVFLILACVCGTIAAIGMSQWMQAQSTGGNTVEMVEIFVTSKTIDIAEEITADKIRLEQWPADRVPQGASGKLEDVEGKFARQRFYEGEPVMPVKLMADANGSSQTIPVGYSVVSMRADPESSVATLVRPGDRVDVMAYFVKSDLIPETTAKSVLTGVRVFAVDGRTEREVDPEVEAKPAKSISLLIHKKDTPAWTYASELGKIRLTLGNPSDTRESEGGNTEGEDFLKWLSDYQIAQAEREESDREETPVSTPSIQAPKKEKKKGFKMLKMSGGVLTEYWIEEGSSVPKVLNESGRENIQEDTKDLSTRPGADYPLPSENELDEPSAPTDYSYLNGSQSPFYNSGPSRGSEAFGSQDKEYGPTSR